jgi:SAM-dependent methyltransferase
VAETRDPPLSQYGPGRFRDALAWLESLEDPPQRVCDLGCGTGALLRLLGGRLPDAELVGLDHDEASVRMAAEEVRCRVVVASIFDDGLLERLGGPFDLVILAAVLHHVIGPTRTASRARAVRALRCAVSLLGERGSLLVVEPTFTPPPAMTALFWVKRVFASSGRRIEIGRWNNIGAPVVSYYGPEEVTRMSYAAGGRVVFEAHRLGRLRRLPKTLGVSGRWESTLVVRRDPRHPLFSA